MDTVRSSKGKEKEPNNLLGSELNDQVILTSVSFAFF